MKDDVDPLGIRIKDGKSKPDRSEVKKVNKKSPTRIGKKILFLEFSLSDTRSGQEQNIKFRIEEAGFEMAKVRLDGKDYTQVVQKWIDDNGEKPVATLKWDEHGGIFGKHQNHKDLAAWSYQNGIAPLAVDFAYFNHYEGYMIDLLEAAGIPSIRREFNEMGDNYIEIKDVKG